MGGFFFPLLPAGFLVFRLAISDSLRSLDRALPGDRGLRKTGQNQLRYLAGPHVDVVDTEVRPC